MWNSSSQEEESGEEGESSKRSSNSQSDSPQGPLQLHCTTTTTCGDSSMEDAEDAKSERRDWHLHKSQDPFLKNHTLDSVFVVFWIHFLVNEKNNHRKEYTSIFIFIYLERER